MNCFNWLSGRAPTKPSTGRPPLKANTAGIDLTRRCIARSWFWSTLILTSRTAPRASRTSFSSAGPSCLHGPHQGAQKSTMTGTSIEASSTSASKVAVLESFIRSPVFGRSAAESMGSMVKFARFGAVRTGAALPKKMAGRLGAGNPYQGRGLTLRDAGCAGSSG